MNTAKIFFLNILIACMACASSHGSESENVDKGNNQPSPEFLRCEDLYKNSRKTDSMVCFAQLAKATGISIEEKDASYRAVAKIAIESGDKELATDVLWKGIGEMPNSADLHFSLCDILYRRDAYQKAITYCYKGWSLMGNVASWHNDLPMKAFATVGDAYVKLNEYDKASEAYQKLLNAKPADVRELGKQRLDNLNRIRVQQK